MRFLLHKFPPKSHSNPLAASTPIHQGLLYTDIIELILHEHRHDAYTLSQCSLVSHALLHISRKLLYRSVSLDYCENPYAYDQQRLLRVSLAAHPHLCHYIHDLRVNLSNDPLLVQIVSQVTRVEKIHVIGGGMPSASAMDGLLRGQVSPLPPATDDIQNQVPHLDYRSSVRSIAPVEESLKWAFGLPSLRRVTLENVFPFSEVYLGCFDKRLQYLEVVSTDPFTTVVPDGFSISTDAKTIEIGAEQGSIPLDCLVLNMDRLQPFLELIKAPSEANSYRRLDLSHLKQAHIYMWNSSEGDALWHLVNRASDTLEDLTLRYFHRPSSLETLTRCLGFANLRTLVLGAPAFGSTEDPLRGLIHLFTSSTTPPSSSDATSTYYLSKFPSLHTLKITFDLWGCNPSSTNGSWRSEISAYRGWCELDEVLSHSVSKDARIVFEVQCNPRYKTCSTVEEGGTELDLISLIKHELYSLRHNPNFILL